MDKIVASCIGCGSVIDLKADAQNFFTQRCEGCRKERDLVGKFGSLIVEGAITQRDLAVLKREFYQLYKFDEQLQARQAEFMQRAKEEMQRVIEEVEGALGQPVRELRAKKAQMEAKLKAYMEESQTNEMVIKDLLVELQNQMVNRGNMPQYKSIVEDLRQLLKWTEEEMETFVQAHYSKPQFADVMTVKPLPPGRRQLRKLRQEGGPTASKTAEANRLVESILQAHQQHGGSTFGLDGQNLIGTANYAVSVFPDRTAILNHAPTGEDIEGFIQGNADIFSDDRVKIGTWHDSSTGEHVLDAVAVVADRDEAIDLGRRYNQKAIFDLKALQEIPTGGSGEKVEGLPEAGERLPKPNVVDNPEQIANPTKVRDGEVMAYHLPEMTLPALAVVHEDFIMTGADICKIDTPSEVFILTGAKVKAHGLHQMVALQAQTKRTLRIADVEFKEGGRMLILIEGKCVADPNTVRAFVADRADEHTIVDTLLSGEDRIAVELAPISKRANDPMAAAMVYFEQLDGILSQLGQLERQRGVKVHEMMGQTEAANQMDLPDSTDDLSLKWEENQPARGGPGSFGDGTRSEGGIMTPNPATGR